MKNQKGQALVEFILILPILLFMVMALIDVASIFLSKYKLENHLDSIVELYEEGKMDYVSQYVSENQLTLNIQEKDEFVVIQVSMNQAVNTPILKETLGKNYEIETERTLYLTSE